MNTQTIPMSIPRKHARIIVTLCTHIHSRQDKTEYKGHIYLFLFQAVPLLIDHQDKFISQGVVAGLRSSGCELSPLYLKRKSW